MRLKGVAAVRNKEHQPTTRHSSRRPSQRAYHLGHGLTIICNMLEYLMRDNQIERIVWEWKSFAPGGCDCRQHFAGTPGVLRVELEAEGGFGKRRQTSQIGSDSASVIQHSATLSPLRRLKD
jgi:hypothetical protein